MNLDEPIIKTIRGALGLDKEDTSFDSDLIMHINSTIGVLNQNGIGRSVLVVSEEQTWNDFINPEQTVGNEFFGMVPSYIMLRTKTLFDPPPPSTVEYYKQTVDELLWRLRTAYDVKPIEEE